MALSDADILNVAKLAKLQLDDHQTKTYSSDLSNILALVDNMQQVDTSQVSPLSNPLDATQRLRPDEITTSNQQKEFLANAPATEAGLFLVPQVIE